MYNASQFVGLMIESIIQQTFKDWELLIVDDGSTDNSVEVVEAYCKNDSRVRLIIRPESRIKGACTCRNIGFEQARGQYVIWFDADDLIAPYCLEQRVKFMDENSDVDFAVFPLISFHNRPCDKVELALGFDIPINPISFFIQGCLWFVICTNIYRIERLRALKIKWSEGLLSRQDCDFNLTCMSKDLIFESGKGLPDYFYRVALNQNSISKGINKGKSRATIDFFNLQYNKLKDANVVLIKSLAHYVFECVMLQNNNEVINEFFKADYFESNVVDRCKFRFLMMGKKLPTRMRSILKLLLFPCSYLRYRRIKIKTNKVRTEWINYASGLDLKLSKIK